jgi:hypothetical protein
MARSIPPVLLLIGIGPSSHGKFLMVWDFVLFIAAWQHNTASHRKIGKWAGVVTGLP